LPEPVSIIGASGALGFGLAVRLARAGGEVVLGSRDHQRARETEARARAAVPGGAFSAAVNAEAASASELVILTVPFRNQAEILHNLRASFSFGQLLLDATVPLAAAIGGKATRTLGVWQGSAAEQAREMVPDGVSVVSGLHTISAASLRDLDCVLDEDVLLAGDRRADKARFAAVLDAIDGLRCVDCGRLEMARVTEQLTALMISINVRYRTHAGAKVTGLPDELWPVPS
jgi:NADPH-dependent F420 reductase